MNAGSSNDDIKKWVSAYKPGTRSARVATMTPAQMFALVMSNPGSLTADQITMMKTVMETVAASEVAAQAEMEAGELDDVERAELEALQAEADRLYSIDVAEIDAAEVAEATEVA